MTADGKEPLEYDESARVIALYLDKFCDESLPYSDMIADASRKAREVIDRLEAERDELRMQVEELTSPAQFGEGPMTCPRCLKYCDGLNELKEQLEGLDETYIAVKSVLEQERDALKAEVEDLNNEIYLLRDPTEDI